MPDPTPTGSDTAFTLAHLSDLHLTSLGQVRARELLGKRVLGYLSWHWHRRHEHLPDVLERLAEDIRAQHPDHVVVTGDLTQLGTPSECREALEWLERFGDPARVSAVPGNHDAYVRAPWEETQGLWAAYMAGDDAEGGFPFLRRRGPVALIGLSSARPTAPFLASGRLGVDQLAGLEQLLEATGKEGCFRVVLLHHPPAVGTVVRRKGLDDARALNDVLARRGAELVLHGHAHRPVRKSLPGPQGPVPVLGVSSASARGARPGRAAAYHLYRITRQSPGWHLEVACRTLHPGPMHLVETDRWELELAGALPGR